VIKLSQADILEFLKENKGWYTSKEISKKLKINQGSIMRSVKILRTIGFIKVKRIRYPFGYKYRY